MSTFHKLVITLLLAFLSPISHSECVIKTASQLANEREVGPILNLQKNKSDGRCDVEFDITVDGISYHLNETEIGLEQEESLCYYAQVRAKKNLLLSLGGTFNTEAITVCNDGPAIQNKDYKIGDLVLESELGKSPIKGYFNYNNARCRMYTERKSIDKELKVYNGVICKVENSASNWIIVDRW